MVKESYEGLGGLEEEQGIGEIQRSGDRRSHMRSEQEDTSKIASYIGTLGR